MSKYDLDERTMAFAKRVPRFVRRIPRSSLTSDDCRQLLKSSGSVGANYIEANDGLSRKDFRIWIKICRKEAKESFRSNGFGPVGGGLNPFQRYAAEFTKLVRCWPFSTSSATPEFRRNYGVAGPAFVSWRASGRGAQPGRARCGTPATRCLRVGNGWRRFRGRLPITGTSCESVARLRHRIGGDVGKAVFVPVDG